jgi:hypothetical protein
MNKIEKSMTELCPNGVEFKSGCGDNSMNITEINY